MEPTTSQPTQPAEVVATSTTSTPEVQQNIPPVAPSPSTISGSVPAEATTSSLVKLVIIGIVILDILLVGYIVFMMMRSY